MVKGLILIMAQLVAGWPVLGQAPGSDATQVLLAAPPPAPVVSANAQTVGNRGSRVFFYWVVANFPVGKSVPYGPAQVNNVADTLTGGNYVRVVWSPVTGATSYDVLRTTTAVLPNGAANIAVATSVSGTLYDNASETINSYTVSSASTASGFWRLDNRNYSLPVLTFSSSFIIPTYIGTTLPSLCVVGQEFFKTDATPGGNKYLCTSANTWTQISGGGSGSCPGGNTGEYQYNNAGSCAGDSALTRLAAGRIQLYDPTGPNTLTVRAGTIQSTTNLVSILDSAGVSLASVNFAGGYTGNSFINTAATLGLGSAALGIGSGTSLRFSSTTAWNGPVDVEAKRSSANNIGITNGSSTTYWTLGASGILAGTDNTYDIGASGASRPRDLFVARNGVISGALSGMSSVTTTGSYLAGASGLYYWSGRSVIQSPSDGVIQISNNAATDFGRLQFGGTTNLFPALKRASTTLQARLADDSAFTTFTSSNLKQGSGSPEGVVSGVVGDIYQNTTGGTGTSAYIKESGVGTTGWVAIAPGAGGSGLFQTLINDLRPTITTTTLTLDAGRCWGANKLAATAVITAGAGNGSFVAYCTDTQTLVVEDATAAGLTITCTNCTRIQTATPQVPEGLYPVAAGTITTGQWTAVTDTRDFTTRFRFQNGTGMATTVVGSVVTEQVDPVQVQMTANDYDVVTRLDATVSTSSAPAKTGTSLPGTCIVGDQYFKSDETAGGNLYGCTTGNVWTKVGPGGAISITDNLYWPFGYGGDTDTKYTPGANVQVVYRITPLATYTLSKLRYRAGTASGYVAFGVVTSNGNTLVTNSNITCNNATVGADNTNQCTLPGNLTLTAGTTYYVVITADAATSYYVVGTQGGVLNWFGGTGNASYIGTATNASTGTGATLAVSVPLGTINAIGGSIAGNQYPSMVYIP